jgi:hypothetical protein
MSYDLNDLFKNRFTKDTGIVDESLPATAFYLQMVVTIND